MEKDRFSLAAQNSITGFLPGVMGFMLLSIACLTFLSSQSATEHLRSFNWSVPLVETACLAVGYTIVALALGSRLLSASRVRGAIAGVAAVSMLGVLSVFFQGANWSMITILSLAAGMISSLILLVPGRSK